jgi:hypothetical protein
MAEANPFPDFSAAWQDWLSQSERQTNEFFNQMMGTEQFGEGMGRNLDLFLHFQKTMNEAMGPYLMTMNIPTRSDILELGERLGSLEDRLAGIEAALVALASSNRSQSGSEATAKPRRTKRPPSRKSAET